MIEKILQLIQKACYLMFGESGAKLLGHILQEAATVIGIVAILVGATIAITSLLDLREQQFKELRQYIIYLHEGLIVMGLIAVAVRGAKYLYKWIRME